MTNVCYIIGYPLGHSLSPSMHNAAFRELDLDLRFESRPVKPEDLGEFVDSSLRAPNVRGGSVTIPHKVSIMSHLDEIDGVASRIGAVNTIVNEDGWLKGHNTDGVGAMRSLEEAYGDLRGKKAIVLGAGGAARAVVYHLSTILDELVILNRTLGRAAELAEDMVKHPECRAAILAGPLRRDHLGGAIADFDLLVNATPLGMSPNIAETPMDGRLLRPGLLVFDIVYNPPKTRLLSEAEAAGARTLSGVGMLVYQGAEAFRLWTGRNAPIDLMMRTVERALGMM